MPMRARARPWRTCRVPGADPGRPGAGGAPRSLPRRDLQRPQAPGKGVRGVFFCYALPALDKEKNEFTEDAGTTRWYLYDLDARPSSRSRARSLRTSDRSPRHAALHHGGEKRSSTSASGSRNTSRTAT